jgi:hypothetical protein
MHAFVKHEPPASDDHTLFMYIRFPNVATYHRMPK